MMASHIEFDQVDAIISPLGGEEVGEVESFQESKRSDRMME